VVIQQDENHVETKQKNSKKKLKKKIKENPIQKEAEHKKSTCNKIINKEFI